MNYDEEDPLGFVRLYESEFGKGSWDKLERGVFERHPEIAIIVISGMIERDEQRRLKARPLWKKLLGVKS